MNDGANRWYGGTSPRVKNVSLFCVVFFLFLAYRRLSPTAFSAPSSAVSEEHTRRFSSAFVFLLCALFEAQTSAHLPSDASEQITSRGSQRARRAKRASTVSRFFREKFFSRVAGFFPVFCFPRRRFRSGDGESRSDKPSSSLLSEPSKAVAESRESRRGEGSSSSTNAHRAAASASAEEGSAQMARSAYSPAPLLGGAVGVADGESPTCDFTGVT